MMPLERCPHFGTAPPTGIMTSGAGAWHFASPRTDLGYQLGGHSAIKEEFCLFCLIFLFYVAVLLLQGGGGGLGGHLLGVRAGTYHVPPEGETAGMQLPLFPS